LTIKSEGDISYLEPKLLRMAGKSAIPLLQFKYDKEKGYHVSCGVRTNEQENKDAERIDRIGAIARKAFAPPAALKYGDAIEAIIKHSQKQHRAAVEIYKEMKAHGMIIKGTDKYYRLKMNDNKE
jgi:hypothetical protein